MVPLLIDKLIMNESCKNESDLYQVAFYGVNKEQYKAICDNIEKNNCRKFIIYDLNWLKKQDLLHLPDIIILSSDKTETDFNKKKFDSEKQLMVDLNIPIEYIGENDLKDVKGFEKKIESIERTIYKTKCLKYAEIAEKNIENIKQRYNENKGNNENLSNELIDEIVNLIKEKDEITYTHVKNVSDYVDIFVSGMPEDKRLTDNQIAFLKKAALLHDVGKLIVPNQILRKNKGLDNDEFHNMKRHVGEKAAYLFNNELLESYKNVALCHHERYDGNGYPNKLSGEEIPYFARIISILDSFDAMTGNRKYVQTKNKKEGNEKRLIDILKDLQANKGKQFDPVMVDYFINGVIKNVDFQRKISHQLYDMYHGGEEDEIRKYI